MVSVALRSFLADLPSHGRTLGRLGDASTSILSVTGAGISLTTEDVPRGSLLATDEVMTAVEDLQFEFGEGPCIDAYSEQLAVLEPDLASPEMARWPRFTPLALDAGVAAIFGFPISVGATRLGALNLYRSSPGELGDVEIEDARELADLMGREVLGLQAEAADGEIAPGLRLNADLQDGVHQACGMVAAQRGTTVEAALILLLDHAREQGRHVQDIAEEVVARRLRFDRPGSTSDDDRGVEP